MLFFNKVDDLVWHSEIFDIISFDVHFGKANEFISFGACLNNFLQSQVHPCVALYQVAVKGLSILKFDEHRVALGRVQESER